METAVIVLSVIVTIQTGAIAFLWLEMDLTRFIAKDAADRAWRNFERIVEEKNLRKKRDQQLAELFGEKARGQ